MINPPVVGDMTFPKLRIGCAGWTISKRHAAAFPAAGSHLERYAQRFTGVEMNSPASAHHLRALGGGGVGGLCLRRQGAPREITHRHRLGGADAALDAFLAQATGLGDKLGPLLFQLPPSLAFDPRTAAAFFTVLRTRFPGDVVCEPRHAEWFVARAEDLMKDFRVCRVAADPPVVQAAADPGGWTGLAYFRLHGSPRIYYSEYAPEQLERFARKVAGARKDGCRVWCIFDNTASGAATLNALALAELMTPRTG